MNIKDVMNDRDAILAVARDAELDGRAEEAAAIRLQIKDLSPLEQLLGRTMRSVTRDQNKTINFSCVDGTFWQMRYEPEYYEPNWCTTCEIEEVVGDLEDLVGAPIAIADESTNFGDPSESFTWTLYRLATVKGYVTVRWYGANNGYSANAMYPSFRRLLVWE
jgi:hypothetical protein